jgi:hypothetical protein
VTLILSMTQKKKTYTLPTPTSGNDSGRLPLVWGVCPFAFSQQTNENCICYIQPLAKGDRKNPQYWWEPSAACYHQYVWGGYHSKPTKLIKSALNIEHHIHYNGKIP